MTARIKSTAASNNHRALGGFQGLNRTQQLHHIKRNKAHMPKTRSEETLGAKGANALV